MPSLPRPTFLSTTCPSRFWAMTLTFRNRISWRFVPVAPLTLHKAHIQHNNWLDLKKQTSESTISQNWKWKWQNLRVTGANGGDPPTHRLKTGIGGREDAEPTPFQTTWSSAAAIKASNNNLPLARELQRVNLKKYLDFPFILNYRYAQRHRKVQVDYRLSSLVEYGPQRRIQLQSLENRPITDNRSPSFLIRTTTRLRVPFVWFTG